MTEDEKRIVVEESEKDPYGGDDLITLVDKEEERKQKIEAYGSETPLLKNDEPPSSPANPESVKVDGTPLQVPVRTKKDEEEEFLQNLKDDSDLPYWAR